MLLSLRAFLGYVVTHSIVPLQTVYQTINPYNEPLQTPDKHVQVAQCFELLRYALQR